MPSRSHSLFAPFPPSRRGGGRRRSRCPYCVQYAALWRQMTVERHYTRLLRAPRRWERVRCPPVMEAEAVAAMTCPGAIPLKTTLRVANHDVAAKTRV